MDKQKQDARKRDLISALLNFKEQAFKLTEAWEKAGDIDTLNVDYPFNRSFDDVCLEIGTWVRRSVKKLATELERDE